ncbi:class I SAM-dependent methyltransferase [Aestuariispira insulae]|uniref:Methyltransferase family protein n=1 Tax=Aestuariispira insulae TaxID=1461337 RepID=A0A3D9H595_9PROT|nr:class I SAM-dependent methyltransferase [Aestuariispira insulae]RED44688.1 methyltransferase family protein [Aestuariispira insulae]
MQQPENDLDLEGDLILRGRLWLDPNIHRPGEGSAEQRLDDILGPFLEAMLDKGPALDMSCGTGILTAVMARRGFGVTGIDCRQTFLAAARSRMARYGYVVDLQNAALVDLTEYDGQFGLISDLSGDLFRVDVARDLDEQLSRAYRLLDADGVLLLGFTDYDVAMAVDGDESCSPARSIFIGNKEYLYFTRRRWGGTPRRPRHELRHYLVCGDRAEIECQEYEALTSESLAVRLERLGFVGIRFFHSGETGFDGLICVAKRPKEGGMAGPGGHEPRLPWRYGRPAPDQFPLPERDRPQRNLPREMRNLDPFHVQPDRRRQMMRTQDASGGLMIERRERVSLVMWSGGVSSTQALHRLLTETDDEVIAHHVCMLEASGRDRPELQACEEIAAILARDVRPFLFTKSTMDRKKFPLPPDPRMACAFEAGIVNLSFYNDRGYAIDRWTLASSLEDEGDWGAVETEFILNCLAASCHPYTVPAFFRFDVMGKSEIKKHLGTRISGLCWSCERPVIKKDGSAEACGHCVKCRP